MNDALLKKMAALADKLDQEGEFDVADQISELIVEAAKDRGDCVFPSTHPKVKDKKDHFPINSKSQAANALARANQFKAAPTWFKGTVKELVNSVSRAVHKKYPGIKQSPASKKPGKG